MIEGCHHSLLLCSHRRVGEPILTPVQHQKHLQRGMVRLRTGPCCTTMAWSDGFHYVDS